ncbi:hypothetical protein FQN50_006497 [Emmonsiellopsis sp. PD_5]|nr:hypothetical protein FQN50_006497 [Emmonsiellopsis sp. PD_5]
MRESYFTFCTEELYTSPVQNPNQNHDDYPPLPVSSAESRIRRMRGSTTDTNPLRKGDFISQDFRVGGPNLPVLPSRLHPTTHAGSTTVWKALSDTNTQRMVLKDIEHVSKKHGITVEHVDFLRAGSTLAQFRDIEPINLISIRSTRRKFDDDSWLKASREIREWFLQRIPPGSGDISVEIFDPRAYRQVSGLRVFPVDKNDMILEHWPEVYERTLDIIGYEGWLALECFRRGTKRVKDHNPITITLTIPYDSDPDRDWRPVRDGIVKILDDLFLPHVAVLIVRGDIWRADGYDEFAHPARLPSIEWQIDPDDGGSIGHYKSARAASTFGGFVQLKMPESERWENFGITSFGAVVENRKRDRTISQHELDCIQRWKIEGILPGDNDAAAQLKMSQPSLRDHRRRIEDLEINLAPFNEEYDISLDLDLPLKNKGNDFFLNEHDYLGHVFAASGCRMTESKFPSQLDWALIKVDGSRDPDKWRPAMHDSSKKDDLWEQARRRNTPSNAREWLHKRGRTTGLRKGKYNEAPSLLLISQQDAEGNHFSEVTYEHAITTGAALSPFAERGDAGAAIFDEDNEFAGLLFGGNVESGVGYFMEKDDIFEDIKLYTGAEDVRVYRNDKSRDKRKQPS